MLPEVLSRRDAEVLSPFFAGLSLSKGTAGLSPCPEKYIGDTAHIVAQWREDGEDNPWLLVGVGSVGAGLVYTELFAALLDRTYDYEGPKWRRPVRKKLLYYIGR